MYFTPQIHMIYAIQFVQTLLKIPNIILYLPANYLEEGVGGCVTYKKGPYIGFSPNWEFYTKIC